MADQVPNDVLAGAIDFGKIIVTGLPAPPASGGTIVNIEDNFLAESLPANAPLWAYNIPAGTIDQSHTIHAHTFLKVANSGGGTQLGYFHAFFGTAYQWQWGAFSPSTVPG